MLDMVMKHFSSNCKTRTSTVVFETTNDLTDFQNAGCKEFSVGLVVPLRQIFGASKYNFWASKCI